MRPEHVEIREKLKKKLKPSRYEHTLGVCYTSVALAMRWGCDLEKAELAGLLVRLASCSVIVCHDAQYLLPHFAGNNAAPCATARR